MVPKRVQSIIKYTLSLAIAGGLFWYVYKDLNLTESIAKLKDANYSWVLLSMCLAIASHIFRAYRWNLLLKPTGYTPSLFRTFFAVMIGYLANLIVPRMGEVSRCGILKKTDGIPMTLSIGTVVAERIIDLLCLITLIVLGFIIEFDRLNAFLSGFFFEKAAMVGKNLFFFYILAGIATVVFLAVFLIAKVFKERIRKNKLYLKTKNFLREMISGFTSVKRVDKKVSFWFSTFMIWTMYYLMSYVVLFALDSTSSLGIGAGIALLIMGGLGMSAPVQGGIGTYHALVTAALVLYGVKESDGQVFAFLLHSSQTLMIIIVGSISLIFSITMKKKVSLKTENEYA